MAKRFLFLLVLAAICLVGSTDVMAQVASTGTFIGTVTDQTGAVIAGATVKIKDNDTGAVIETKSSADGHITVANMKPGTYTVSVSMQGFKSAEFRSVKIVVGQTYDLAAKLEVGALESTVVVEAGAEVLETSKSAVGTSITGKSILQLPLTARDALDLALLMPGAAATGRPRETAFMGLPKGAINITYDGINAQDNILKSSDGFFTTIRPRVDSVDEFSISTAGGGAESAAEGAVQINFSTKRGGNEYHGGVWWYHRNDWLNANYYFNNEVPTGSAQTPRQRMRLNQYGWKASGPVWKDKVFFFTAFDIYKKPDSTTRQRTILTTEATAGTYRYNTVLAHNPATSGNPSTTSVCLGGAAGGCVGTFLTSPLPAMQSWMNCGGAFVPGYVGIVPVGTNCAATLLGTPTSLAAVTGTTNTLDTVMAGFLNAINGSTSVSGVTLASAPSPWQRTIQFNNTAQNRRYFPDARVDWNISRNHQLTGIYHLGKFYATPDILNARDATYPVAPFDTLIASQNSIRHEIVAAWRWNIGTNKSNEVRFGVVTAPIWFFNDQQTGAYPVITHNLGSIFVRPSFFGVTQPFLPYDPANGGPQPRNTGLGQLNETFSWTRGKHSMNFGITATSLYGGIATLSYLGGSLTLGMNQFDPANANFTAPSSFPGSNTTDQSNTAGLYAMLTGRITGYSASVALDPKTKSFVTGAPLLEKYRQNEYGFFGTDTWRVSSSLTFNYGLRWEFQPSPYDTQGIYLAPDAGEAGVFGVSGLNNLFQPGTMPGVSPTFSTRGSGKWYNTDKKSLAPSVGLAWQPGYGNRVWKTLFGEAGKTVFRAGYSINFTREGTNNFLGVTETNPGYTGTQVSNASSTATTGTFIAGSQQLQSLTLNNGLGSTVLQNPGVFTPSGFAPDPATNYQTAAYRHNIKIPLVHSWSFGFQREITSNMVVEVRYVGNHGSGLWRLHNMNETNIFENGFLSEFGRAQLNLQLCQANPGAAPGTTLPFVVPAPGTCRAQQIAGGVQIQSTTTNTFANWGMPGQTSLPIFTAAFTGTNATAVPGPTTYLCPALPNTASAGQCNTNFTTFTTQFGLANLTPVPGSIASSIAGSLPFMCNLAGRTAMNSVSCPATAPLTGLFPVNFFRANPQSRGGSFIMANDAHSTYNGLTVEVRRRMSKGVQFSANYVFSKSLTNLFGNSSLNNVNFFTLRDKGYDKGPSPWDLRHQFKFNGIWELPFGPGKRWNTSHGWFNRIIEGWETSATNRWQTGRVFRIDGGISGSANGNDGGVQLVGITTKQIQDSLSVRKLANGTVWYFPESLITCNASRSSCTANTTFMRACRTAGQFCQRLFLYGPSFFRADINIVKRTKITERVNFEFRAEFLNAFNNINFYFPGSSTSTVATSNLQSTSFGKVTSSYQDVSTTDDPGGRIIQVVLRVNF